MNAVAWFQLFHLLSGAPKDVTSLAVERRMAFECVERKECVSVWRDDLQDWVVYRKEDLAKANATPEVKNEQDK